VTVLDPTEVKLPVMEVPAFYTKEVPEHLKAMDDAIMAADAIVVISPEYNHSIPPALSNLMDHFGGSRYAYKPSGICVYSPGAYGGVRCAMALRPFLSELGCLPVSNIFAIPHANESLNEDGTASSDEMNARLERNLDTFAKQLEWWGEAAMKQRQSQATA
jgi:NAD(P)H-dependent FMN reductase